MNRFPLYFLFYLIGYLFLNTALAQDSKLIELRSADRLEGKVINNEEVRELIGNVHFIQKTADRGLVKVWCDKALRFMQQNKIELYGNVKVIRDSSIILTNEGIYFGENRIVEGKSGVKLIRGNTTLTAENGKYLIDEKTSHFINNVNLIDSTSTITCHELYYYETDTRSIAIKNVHIYDYENSINIYGDSLIHFEKEKTTIILKNPRLVKIDTSSSGTIDTMVVVSKEMYSYKDTSERFVAKDSVKMARSDLSARCGLATYYTKNDVIVLQKSPIIWSSNNQITGDSIRIKIEDKKIRSLWAKNRAMIISQVDTLFPNRYNQLTGRELTMYFDENKLERIDIQKNAISFYYIFDNDKPNGANKSTGDRILINFIDGKVEKIKIIGGVQGQYFPEKLILGKERDYNLDGFRLYKNQPKRIGEYIID